MNTNKTIRHSNALPHQKAFLIYKIVTVLLAFSLAALAVVLFFTNANQESRYLPSSIFTTILCILVILNVLFASSALIVFRKNSLEIKKQHTSIHPFIMFLPAIASIPCILYNVSLITSGNTSTLAILTALTSISAVAYPLSCALSFSKSLKLIFGYIQIIFYALAIAQLYMDFTAEMNSPLKVFIQFSFVMLMINTITDLRITVESPNVSQFVFSKALLIPLAFTSFALSISSFASGRNLYENISYLIYPIAIFSTSIIAVIGLASPPFTNRAPIDQTEPLYNNNERNVTPSDENESA